MQDVLIFMVIVGPSSIIYVTYFYQEAVSNLLDKMLAFNNVWLKIRE